MDNPPRFFAWVLGSIAVMVFGVVACARADTLEDVKADVDSRFIYSNFVGAHLPTRNEGYTNCHGFAFEYMVAAKRQGILGSIEACNLKDGGGHAFFQAVDGRVLDVRHKGVITMQEVGCR